MTAGSAEATPARKSLAQAMLGSYSVPNRDRHFLSYNDKPIDTECLSSDQVNSPIVYLLIHCVSALPTTLGANV